MESQNNLNAGTSLDGTAGLVKAHLGQKENVNNMNDQKHNSIAENILVAHSRIANEYAGGIGSGVCSFRDSKHAYMRWEDRMFRRIFSSIFSEVRLPESAMFLDAGCGNGQWMDRVFCQEVWFFQLHCCGFFRLNA